MRILGAVALLAGASLSLMAQTAPVFPDSLKMEEAVRMALQYHPAIRGAEAGIRSSEAVLTQSESNYFPSLIASATSSRTDGAFVFNPSFPARLQTYDNYTTSLSLQQTIWDFGRTSGRVSAGSDLAQASREDYQSTRNAVIAGVEIAYINFVQAQRLVTVAKQSVAQAELHLKQAQAFYKVGTRPQFDVTKSEVDLANANVNLIHAQNQTRIARVQLENAIGLHTSQEFAVEDVLNTPPFSVPLDSVKAIAAQRRPELLSARAKVSAAQSLVSAAWGQHMPSLSLNGAWTWNGFNFPLQSRWTAGVTLALPIFEGNNISAQVQQAEASADIASSSLDALTESAMLDVEQNYLALREARDQITATGKLVVQAEENLKIAEGRYNSGVGSPIEVTDAQVNLDNARITNIQALAGYSSSLIRLQQAMGTIGD